MITRAHRRIVWTSPAEQDLTDAALWYAEHQRELADQFLSAVRAAPDNASASPSLYARVHGELRRVLVHRFPYALIFREAGGDFIVVACYHLRRHPNVWQSRG